MSKEKAKAVFLRRFDALVDSVRDRESPVVHINRRDWHWIAPLTEDDGVIIRYQGVEIIVVD